MYVPAHNRNDDRAELIGFMRHYNFAALVTAEGGVPVATHLPFLVEERDGVVRLCAHLARANPQARGLADDGPALVIFQGPHAYVSPAHYQRHPSVPTWNYAAVHAGGVLRRLDGGAEKAALLERLVAAHDAPYLESMRKLPPGYLEARLEAIVAFEVRVERLDARWKLSQDRSPAERGAIVAALEASPDAAAAALAALMRRHEPAA
ncbi:MAG: FMN-binding negative transcriptional regulator [Nevskia sp.]|nr:FMN-binding negative transcriptional regulator [Nevskia sp.]